jgi:hypothetical protein
MTNRRLDPGDVEELVRRWADICDAVGEEDESVTRSKRGIAFAHWRRAREPERRPGDRQWFDLLECAVLLAESSGRIIFSGLGRKW